MIPAAYYQTIYLILVTIMTWGAYSQYQSRNGLREFKHTTTDAIGIALRSPCYGRCLPHQPRCHHDATAAKHLRMQTNPGLVHIS